MAIQKIVVCEYATLVCGEHVVKNDSLAEAVIPASAFAWLATKAEENAWGSILSFQNAKTLKLAQYVGYLETPCGVGIEILPKSTAKNLSCEQDPIANAREILWHMLNKGLGTKACKTDVADLQAREQPIHEWVFAQFLQQLKLLVLRGIRHDYENLAEESRFIRGRVDVHKQITNHAACKHTHFHINHDVYTPNRVENRLLATAVRLVKKFSLAPNNQQLARELSGYFADLPDELAPNQVWGQWQKSRLLLHYEAIKPWCRMILLGENPDWMAGEHQGIALLFNMNTLFEHYVAHCLSDIYHVQVRPSSKRLLGHGGQKLLALEPDLILNHEIVADSKWKLVNHTQSASAQGEPLGLTPSDLYQLGMHGLNYLPDSQGKLVLFYPEHEQFHSPVRGHFLFNPKIQLLLIPFPLLWEAGMGMRIRAWIDNDGI